MVVGVWRRGVNLLGNISGGLYAGIATKFSRTNHGAVLAAIIVWCFIIRLIQKRPKGLFPQKGRGAE